MCGLQAFYKLAVAVSMCSSGYDVVGAVVGWGRVYLHENGWRAEYAQPLAFTPIGKPTAGFQRTSRQLGVPIIRQDLLQDYAAEFGVDPEARYWRKHVVKAH